MVVREDVAVLGDDESRAAPFDRLIATLVELIEEVLEAGRELGIALTAQIAAARRAFGGDGDDGRRDVLRDLHERVARLVDLLGRLLGWLRAALLRVAEGSEVEAGGEDDATDEGGGRHDGEPRACESSHTGSAR